MPTIRAAVLTAAAVALSGACGGPGASVEEEQAAKEAQARAEESARAEAEAAEEEEEHLTDEDFEVRLIEEVEAPTYLQGIDRAAQDEFRIGVQASMATPPRYELAARKFREAVGHDPEFMEAYFNLGQTLERMGERDEALRVYQEALEENPDDPSATAYIAKIYLGKARHEEIMGEEAEARRWFDEAKGLLDQVIGDAPENEAVNNAMALYYLAQGDLKTSERYVKEVLYVEPTNVTALNTRGLINLRRGEYLIAEWIFENKVLSEDPNSTEALTNLGFTYVKLGKRPLAMRYFARALEQSPDNMEVRMNIAALLLEHLDYAGAYGHYTRVREAQPLNIEAHEGQCDAAYGLGGSADDSKAQFEEAIACYVALLERKPERVELYERIAETYQQKLQNLEQAVAYFERYVAEADLTPEEAQKTQNTVKVLKDIIAKGGLKAMMGPEPAPEDEEGEEGADGEMIDVEEGDDEAEGIEEEGAAPAEDQTGGDEESADEPEQEETPGDAGPAEGTGDDGAGEPVTDDGAADTAPRPETATK